MISVKKAYPIQDKEMLAVVQTLEKFCPELIDQKFFVIIDYQILIYFSTKRILLIKQVR
jgi:hypothetical protein